MHEKAWCPARSMQYAYPKAKVGDVKPKIKKPVNEITSSRSESAKGSYSSASFESADGESEADSSLDEESVNTPGLNSRGVRRTIQVCCQTLDYWRTCDHA